MVCSNQQNEQRLHSGDRSSGIDLFIALSTLPVTLIALTPQRLWNLPYMGGFTNTSGGIFRMRTEQFRYDRGDRPRVSVLCSLAIFIFIMLRDGEFCAIFTAPWIVSCRSQTWASC